MVTPFQREGEDKSSTVFSDFREDHHVFLKKCNLYVFYERSKQDIRNWAIDLGFSFEDPRLPFLVHVK